MNLELLKKLTRLANNNPNENEANLAARRVCKMLEEGNFSLSNAGPAPDSDDFVRNMQQQAYRYAAEASARIKREEEAAREKARRYTAEREQREKERKKEQRRRSIFEDEFDFGRKYYAYQGAQAHPNDTWVRTGDGMWVNSRTGQEVTELEYYANFAKKSDPKRDSPPFNWEQPKREEKKERELECTECRDKKWTKYVGHPGTFVCYNCQWRKHNAEREST